MGKLLSEIFETVTCSRCGGEGRILTFSNVLGGICFRCNGGKVTFTRRGQRDRDAYTAACDAITVKPVSQVKVGDFVRSDNMSKYASVLAIGEPVLSGWSGPEMTPHYSVEITLSRAVWHDLHCPLTYKGDKFSASCEGTIRIHPGNGILPGAETFDSRHEGENRRDMVRIEKENR